MNYYVLAFSLKILRRTYPLSDTQIVFIPQKVKKRLERVIYRNFCQENVLSLLAEVKLIRTTSSKNSLSKISNDQIFSVLALIRWITSLLSPFKKYPGLFNVKKLENQYGLVSHYNVCWQNMSHFYICQNSTHN